MSNPPVPGAAEREAPAATPRIAARSLPSSRSATDRGLEAALCLGVLALGAWLAWRTRFRVNSDALNYLDLGDAIFRTGWGRAVNGLWSPLYPAILGFTMKILRPSSYWESTVAHGVNFLLYAAGFASFRYFLRELRELFPSGADGRVSMISLPPKLWSLFGYTLFAGCSLVLIRISVLSPDLLVAALVYLAAGLLLRIAGGERGFPPFAVLGAVLGLAYLAKTPMWWGALLFLAAAFGIVRDVRVAAPRIALAAALFVLIGSLYFLPLSRIKGRPTIGDSARLNFAFHLNEKTVYWQGEPAGSGTAVHPMRQLLTAPGVYEFSTPIGGTYPPWYDPSYWMEGVSFAWKPQHARKILLNVLDLYWVFTSFQASLFVGLMVLYAFAGKGPASLRKMALRLWYVVLPSLAILSMYALVHVESRYVSPFIALLWLGLYSGVALPDTAGARRLIGSVALAVVLGMWVGMAGDLVLLTSSEQAAAGNGNVQWKVAQQLKRSGIRPGDQLATLGAGNTAYWARLAGARIVAQTRLPGDLWAADENTRREILRVLAKTGVQGVVGRDVPPGALSAGWLALGDTGFSFYRFGR